jgi:hypothetical protein
LDRVSLILPGHLAALPTFLGCHFTSHRCGTPGLAWRWVIMDDKHDQVVRELTQQLEMPSDYSAVCVGLALVMLLLVGGYFAIKWFDPVMETQVALSLFSGR